MVSTIPECVMSLRSAILRRGPARRRPPWRFAPRVVPLEVRTLLSTITVTNDNDAGPGSLRAAIAASSSGDTIKFAPSADGTITLTSGPLVVQYINLNIEGPGADKLTISGNGDTTVFELFSVLPPTDPPPPDFTPNSVKISGVTIADGNASNNFAGSGGAILSYDALTLTDSVLEDNQAPQGMGGAIYSGCCDNASLDVERDVFSGNTAGSTSGGDFFALGGAIYTAGGTTATVADSTFTGNQAIGQYAQGGAIQASTSFSGGVGGTLTVSGSTFTNNMASGSFSASGGAIFGDPNVVVTVDSSEFTDNEAEASGFGGGSGGAIDVSPGNVFFPTFGPISAIIANSVFSGNKAVGTGDTGAQGEGGAIYATGGGNLVVSGSTLIGNEAIGADGSASTGSTGGVATGGAIQNFSCALTLTSDTFSSNEALGGSSPLGVIFAIGGGVNSLFQGPSTISDSLFSGNQAIAGSGGGTFSLTGGGAVGFVGSPVTVTDTAFLGNQVVGSTGGAGGAGTAADGGAIWTQGQSMTIQDSLIAGNSATGGNGGAASGAPGGAGGNGGGGGIAALLGSAITLDGTDIHDNSAIGGNGGQGSTTGTGGTGEGGGILVDNTSTLTMDGGTIMRNQAIGGAGGGNGEGGGVYNSGTASFSDVRIMHNSAIGGSGGGQGTGGGLYISAGTVTLSNHTKVAHNSASNSNDDIYGNYTTG
jgi:hypothetical protein